MALMERAERWRGEPVQLPRGVELVTRTDAHGAPIHVLEWTLSPPPVATACAFNDPVVAIEMAWTSFMMRRPWAIDDARLHAIVEHPPASHATILGGLLSVHLAEWVREAIATMSARATESPPPAHDASAKQDFLASLDHLDSRLEVRTAAALLELGTLFGVEEPNARMFYDIGRWRCMMLDYCRLLDEELLTRVLAPTRSRPDPKTTPRAWRELQQRREIDTCVGLLLAYAAMRESGPRSSHGFTDAMATDAIGSFAWWCRWALDTWEDDRTLGSRIAAADVEELVGSARRHLEGLAPALLVALCRVVPRVAQ